MSKDYLAKALEAAQGGIAYWNWDGQLVAVEMKEAIRRLDSAGLLRRDPELEAAAMDVAEAAASRGCVGLIAAFDAYRALKRAREAAARPKWTLEGPACALTVGRNGHVVARLYDVTREQAEADMRALAAARGEQP